MSEPWVRILRAEIFYDKFTRNKQQKSGCLSLLIVIKAVPSIRFAFGVKARKKLIQISKKKKKKLLQMANGESL